jgi:hypothetical protein
MNHVEGHIKKKIVRFGSQENFDEFDSDNEENEDMIKKGKYYW